MENKLNESRTLQLFNIKFKTVEYHWV